LIAVPLLIATQPACILRLGVLARHFLDSGLVVESDHEGFAAATASTLRLRDATVIEFAVIAVAYAIVAAVFYSESPANLPAWNFLENPLQAQRLSAMSNINTLAANIYAMRLIPVDTRSVIALVAMTLLPFLPVVLIVLPLDVVVKDLAKFLI